MYYLVVLVRNASVGSLCYPYKYAPCNDLVFTGAGSIVILMFMSTSCFLNNNFSFRCHVIIHLPKFESCDFIGPNNTIYMSFPVPRKSNKD